MMMSLGRIALAVVVLASIGCDASADRVYDDTTLRLTGPEARSLDARARRGACVAARRIDASPPTMPTLCA